MAAWTAWLKSQHEIGNWARKEKKPSELQWCHNLLTFKADNNRKKRINDVKIIGVPLSALRPVIHLSVLLRCSVGRCVEDIVVSKHYVNIDKVWLY